MDMEQIQPYLDKAIELSMAYLPKAVLALVTLVVGFWIIKRVIKGMNRVLGHPKMVHPTKQNKKTSKGLSPPCVPHRRGSVASVRTSGTPGGPRTAKLARHLGL